MVVAFPPPATSLHKEAPMAAKATISVFWIPLLLGGAGIAGGWALATDRYTREAWAIVLVLCVGAAVLAYRLPAAIGGKRAGQGGNASVHGDHSEAIGGRGGDAGTGVGGKGGDAAVEGNTSKATGGDGGRG
jgi:hypothetical protein